jgi:hypothetical protein
LIEQLMGALLIGGHFVLPERRSRARRCQHYVSRIFSDTVFLKSSWSPVPVTHRAPICVNMYFDSYWEI